MLNVKTAIDLTTNGIFLSLLYCEQDIGLCFLYENNVIPT
jgi:hypothetical protein